MPTVAIIPVKSFALGKQRLSGALDPARRARLARGLAERVATVAVGAGLMPLVVTGDPHVAEWATRAGFPSVGDPGEGLDVAAGTGVDWAGASGSNWIVLHADLPLIDVSDVTALTGPLGRGPVIAPSSDGGTTALGSTGPSAFAFGQSSFHRHLKMLPNPQVVARPGLLLDIDSPTDLKAAGTHPRGRWIRELIAGTGTAEPGQILY